MIAVLYWFFGTELGHGLRATGTNEAMSRSNGINTDTNKVIGLIISNGIVALSGAMLAQFQGFSDVNMGRGAIVIGLAAVIIGEALGILIMRSRFNFVAKLAFTAVGAIIYFLVLQLVMLLGLPSANNKLFSAIVVAIFLAVPYIKKNYKLSDTWWAKLGRNKSPNE